MAENQYQRRVFSDKRDNKDDEIQNIVSEFRQTWITNGSDKDMISYTEKAGKFMKEKNLTSSKIRNVYGEVKRIQMAGYEKEKTSFYLLKPKMAYALGRDKNVKGLDLFKRLFDKCFDCVKDEKTYKNFCNFIEALIAYHRSFGGK